MNTNILDSLIMSFNNLWNDIVYFLPDLLIAILVLVVGWIVGGILKGVIEHVFMKLKVNEALDKAGVGRLTSKTGYTLKAGVFVGSLVKWFVIAVFAIAALDILNLDQVTIFLREVVLGYLPNVIVAVLILLVASVVANVASASVAATARATGFGSASVLGSITRYSILVFAVLAVLSQLEIAPELVQIFFTGVVFAASLAFGLAFGFGGKEAAGKYIAKITDMHSDR